MNNKLETIHHMTIKKMKKEQKLFEEKLNNCEARIKDWLPIGYNIEFVFELGIINEETNNFIYQTHEEINYSDKIRLERAFDWLEVFNSTYNAYKKHLREMDRLGII